MSKTVLSNARHNSFVLFLFYFMLFSYPMMSLLWRRSYSFFAIEVGVIFLSITIISILLTVILRNVRPAIVNMLSLLFITIIYLVQFNALFFGLITCILIGLVLAWRLGTKFQLYCLPVMITLVIGAYFDSAQNDGQFHSTESLPSTNLELPPVVHILLDGFIGIEGMPPYASAAALKNQMYSFFEEHDFQVSPYAYSRYARTGDSVYSAMNFKHDGLSEYRRENFGQSQHMLKTNAEFDVMEELGYRLSIYQPGYLDFCYANPDRLDRCWEYDHPNLTSIAEAKDIFLRARMLTYVLMGQSTLLTNFSVLKGELLHPGITFHDPLIFTNLKNDLVSEARGRFYFAHILLPHDPFVFMDDCSINYDSPVWARYANIKDEKVQTDDTYEIRTMKYFEQLKCAMNSLGQVFEGMKAAGIFEQSIIVVHGDHGSRIGKYPAEYKNLGYLTKLEYRANFSTLFAVKIPGQAGRVDDRTLPLSFLLEMFSKAVVEFVADSETTEVLVQTLPDEKEKKAPYVYLPGTYSLTRVDIDIFED